MCPMRTTKHTFTSMKQKYSIDDLDSVVDADYLNAYNKAYNFTVKLNKLPNVNGIDSTDGESH